MRLILFWLTLVITILTSPNASAYVSGSWFENKTPADDYDNKGLYFDYFNVITANSWWEADNARIATLVGIDLEEYYEQSHVDFNGLHVDREDGIHLMGDVYFHSTGYSITKIGKSALENVKDKIHFGCYNVTIIEDRALAGTLLDSIDSSALMWIYDSACEDCPELHTLILPNIRRIYDNAFSGCHNLKHIEFGKETVSIREGAFDALEGGWIITSGLPTEIHEKAFSQKAYATTAVYVPEAYLESYQSTNGWKNFKNFYTLESRVSQITIPSSLSLAKGMSEELTTILIPENAGTSTLSWTTDNADVATVENGIITAHRLGTAKITVNTPDGISASCEVTVIEPYPTSISLSHTSIMLKAQETYQLSAELSPEEIYYSDIIWSSSNSEIAKVNDNGLVTGLTVGTAEIIATTSNGLTAECAIIVDETLATEVVIDKTIPGMRDNRLEMNIHDTVTIKASLLPTTTTDTRLTFESTDSTIAIVDKDGQVTALASGIAKIIVTAASGVSTSIDVYVLPSMAESILLSETYSEIYVGQTLILQATVYPEHTTDKTLTWTSSRTEIATVSNNGEVVGKGVGSVIITVTCGDVSTTCVVKVRAIEATDLLLDFTELTLNVGDIETLTPIFLPQNTTDKTIKWHTDNSAVVLVNETGVIHCIQPGTALITATSINGLSASCHVTVVSEDVEVDSLTLNYSDCNLWIGNTLQLIASVHPDNATDKTIIWDSSNTEVAVVDNDGSVTAIGEGSTLISASTSNGLRAYCKVSVLPIQIQLNISNAVLADGEHLQLIAYLTPDDTSDNPINWSSSDESVAIVSEDGLVTPVGDGTAIIEARCGDVAAYCEVTVEILYTGIYDICEETEYPILLFTIEGHGITVSDPEEYKRLNPGIYIWKGRKVFVK